jgi:hypothetical protein
MHGNVVCNIKLRMLVVTMTGCLQRNVTLSVPLVLNASSNPNRSLTNSSPLQQRLQAKWSLYSCDASTLHGSPDNNSTHYRAHLHTYLTSLFHAVTAPPQLRARVSKSKGPSAIQGLNTISLATRNRSYRTHASAHNSARSARAPRIARLISPA